MPIDHRDIKPDNMPHVSDNAAGGTPGKRTRTDGLPAPRTGFGLIDRGPLCEQPGTQDLPGCNLNEHQRTRMIAILNMAAGTAMDNFVFALQTRRIELLTASGPGWGFFEQMLFDVTSGVVAGAIIKGALGVVRRGAAKMAETSWDSMTLRLANVDEKAIKGLYVTASRSVRSDLKHRRTALPPGNNGKAAFLEGIQHGIKPFLDDMASNAPANWDDDTLVAVAHGYQDLDVHGTEAYGGVIDGLIAGYDRNQLDDVGMTASHGKRVGQDFADEEFQRGRLAWVSGLGQTRRLGLFEGTRGDKLIKFIESDYAQLAIELFRSRTGAEPGEETLPPALHETMGADRAWLDSFLAVR